MKNSKTLYWVITGTFSGIFLISGTLYFIQAPLFVAKMSELGLPLFLLRLLGTAKIAGALTLILPKAPARLKEWAYAGFTFNLIGAFWSHVAVHGFSPDMLLILMLIGLLVGSYISWQKLNSKRAITEPNTIKMPE